MGDTSTTDIDCKANDIFGHCESCLSGVCCVNMSLESDSSDTSSNEYTIDDDERSTDLDVEVGLEEGELSDSEILHRLFFSKIDTSVSEVPLSVIWETSDEDDQTETSSSTTINEDLLTLTLDCQPESHSEPDAMPILISNQKSHLSVNKANDLICDIENCFVETAMMVEKTLTKSNASSRASLSTSSLGLSEKELDAEKLSKSVQETMTIFDSLVNEGLAGTLKLRENSDDERRRASFADSHDEFCYNESKCERELSPESEQNYADYPIFEDISLKYLDNEDMCIYDTPSKSDFITIYSSYENEIERLFHECYDITSIEPSTNLESCLRNLERLCTHLQNTRNNILENISNPNFNDMNNHGDPSCDSLFKESMNLVKHEKFSVINELIEKAINRRKAAQMLNPGPPEIGRDEQPQTILTQASPQKVSNENGNFADFNGNSSSFDIPKSSGNSTTHYQYNEHDCTKDNIKNTNNINHGELSHAETLELHKDNQELQESLLSILQSLNDIHDNFLNRRRQEYDETQKSSGILHNKIINLLSENKTKEAQISFHDYVNFPLRETSPTQLDLEADFDAIHRIIEISDELKHLWLTQFRDLAPKTPRRTGSMRTRNNSRYFSHNKCSSMPNLLKETESQDDVRSMNAVRLFIDNLRDENRKCYEITLNFLNKIMSIHSQTNFQSTFMPQRDDYINVGYDNREEWEINFTQSMAALHLAAEGRDHLMWCADSDFDAAVSALDIRGLIELVQTLQDAMSVEQQTFESLSVQLEQTSDPLLQQRLSAALCTSQTRLARLCARNMRCFTHQALKARPKDSLDSRSLSQRDSGIGNSSNIGSDLDIDLSLSSDASGVNSGSFKNSLAFFQKATNITVHNKHSGKTKYSKRHRKNHALETETGLADDEREAPSENADEEGTFEQVLFINGKPQYKEEMKKRSHSYDALIDARSSNTSTTTIRVQDHKSRSKKSESSNIRSKSWTRVKIGGNDESAVVEESSNYCSSQPVAPTNSLREGVHSASLTDISSVALPKRKPIINFGSLSSDTIDSDFGGTDHQKVTLKRAHSYKEGLDYSNENFHENKLVRAKSCYDVLSASTAEFSAPKLSRAPSVEEILESVKSLRAAKRNMGKSEVKSKSGLKGVRKSKEYTDYGLQNSYYENVNGNQYENVSSKEIIYDSPKNLKKYDASKSYNPPLYENLHEPEPTYMNVTESTLYANVEHSEQPTYDVPRPTNHIYDIPPTQVRRVKDENEYDTPRNNRAIAPQLVTPGLIQAKNEQIKKIEDIFADCDRDSLDDDHCEPDIPSPDYGSDEDESLDRRKTNPAEYLDEGLGESDSRSYYTDEQGLEVILEEPEEDYINAHSSEEDLRRKIGLHLGLKGERGSLDGSEGIGSAEGDLHSGSENGEEDSTSSGIHSELPLVLDACSSVERSPNFPLVDKNPLREHFEPISLDLIDFSELSEVNELRKFVEKDDEQGEVVRILHEAEKLAQKDKNQYRARNYSNNDTVPADMCISSKTTVETNNLNMEKNIENYVDGLVHSAQVLKKSSSLDEFSVHICQNIKYSFNDFQSQSVFLDDFQTTTNINAPDVTDSNVLQENTNGMPISDTVTVDNGNATNDNSFNSIENNESNESLSKLDKTDHPIEVQVNVINSGNLYSEEEPKNLNDSGEMEIVNENDIFNIMQHAESQDSDIRQNSLTAMPEVTISNNNFYNTSLFNTNDSLKEQSDCEEFERNEKLIMDKYPDSEEAHNPDPNDFFAMYEATRDEVYKQENTIKSTQLRDLSRKSSLQDEDKFDKNKNINNENPSSDSEGNCDNNTFDIEKEVNTPEKPKIGFSDIFNDIEPMSTIDCDIHGEVVDIDLDPPKPPPRNRKSQSVSCLISQHEKNNLDLQAMKDLLRSGCISSPFHDKEPPVIRPPRRKKVVSASMLDISTSQFDFNNTIDVPPIKPKRLHASVEKLNTCEVIDGSDNSSYHLKFASPMISSVSGYRFDTQRASISLVESLMSESTEHMPREIKPTPYVKRKSNTFSTADQYYKEAKQNITDEKTTNMKTMKRAISRTFSLKRLTNNENPSCMPNIWKRLREKQRKKKSNKISKLGAIPEHGPMTHSETHESFASIFMDLSSEEDLSSNPYVDLESYVSSSFLKFPTESETNLVRSSSNLEIPSLQQNCMKKIPKSRRLKRSSSFIQTTENPKTFIKRLVTEDSTVSLNPDAIRRAHELLNKSMGSPRTERAASQQGLINNGNTANNSTSKDTPGSTRKLSLAQRILLRHNRSRQASLSNPKIEKPSRHRHFSLTSIEDRKYDEKQYKAPLSLLKTKNVVVPTLDVVYQKEENNGKTIHCFKIVDESGNEVNSPIPPDTPTTPSTPIIEKTCVVHEFRYRPNEKPQDIDECSETESINSTQESIKLSGSNQHETDQNHQSKVVLEEKECSHIGSDEDFNVAYAKSYSKVHKDDDAKKTDEMMQSFKVLQKITNNIQNIQQTMQKHSENLIKSTMKRDSCVTSLSNSTDSLEFTSDKKQKSTDSTLVSSVAPNSSGEVGNEILNPSIVLEEKLNTDEKLIRQESIAQNELNDISIAQAEIEESYSSNFPLTSAFSEQQEIQNHSFNRIVSYSGDSETRNDSLYRKSLPSEISEDFVDNDICNAQSEIEGSYDNYFSNSKLPVILQNGPDNSTATREQPILNNVEVNAESNKQPNCTGDLEVQEANHNLTNAHKDIEESYNQYFSSSLLSTMNQLNQCTSDDKVSPPVTIPEIVIVLNELSDKVRGNFEENETQNIWSVSTNENVANDLPSDISSPFCLEDNTQCCVDVINQSYNDGLININSSTKYGSDENKEDIADKVSYDNQKFTKINRSDKLIYIFPYHRECQTSGKNITESDSINNEKVNVKSSEEIMEKSYLEGCDLSTPNDIPIANARQEMERSYNMYYSEVDSITPTNVEDELARNQNFIENNMDIHHVTQNSGTDLEFNRVITNDSSLQSSIIDIEQSYKIVMDHSNISEHCNDTSESVTTETENQNSSDTISSYEIIDETTGDSLKQLEEIHDQGLITNMHAEYNMLEENKLVNVGSGIGLNDCIQVSKLSQNNVKVDSSMKDLNAIINFYDENAPLSHTNHCIEGSSALNLGDLPIPPNEDEHIEQCADISLVDIPDANTSSPNTLSCQTNLNESNYHESITKSNACSNDEEVKETFWYGDQSVTRITKTSQCIFMFPYTQKLESTNDKPAENTVEYNKETSNQTDEMNESISINEDSSISDALTFSSNLEIQLPSDEKSTLHPEPNRTRSKKVLSPITKRQFIVYSPSSPDERPRFYNELPPYSPPSSPESLREPSESVTSSITSSYTIKSTVSEVRVRTWSQRNDELENLSDDDADGTSGQVFLPNNCGSPDTPSPDPPIEVKDEITASLQVSSDTLQRKDDRAQKDRCIEVYPETLRQRQRNMVPSPTKVDIKNWDGEEESKGKKFLPSVKALRNQFENGGREGSHSPSSSVSLGRSSTSSSTSSLVMSSIDSSSNSNYTASQSPVEAQPITQETETVVEPIYRQFDQSATNSNGHAVSTTEWNPESLLRKLYTITDVPKSNGKGKGYINIEGYLEKLPSGRKKSTYWNAWKKRFFSAQDGVLYCYQSHQKEKLGLKLPLMGGRIEVMDPNVFSIEDGKDREKLCTSMLGIDDGKGHYVVVRCTSRQEAEKWKSALDTHVVEDCGGQSVQPIPFPTNPTMLRDTIVIDIGCASVRAGVLASQATLPQVFFPSVVATNRETQRQIWGTDALAAKVRETSNVSFPIRPSHRISKYSVDLTAVSSLLQKAFQDLKVDPKNYNIQLSVPRVLNQNTQAEILRTLFEKHEVKGVNLTHQSILSLFAYNATSGIVVDVGERIDVVPVTDGYIVDGGVSRVPYGGSRIVEHLKHFLSQQNISLVNELDSYVLRAILESICYCARDYNSEKAKCANDPEEFTKEASLGQFFPSTSQFEAFHNISLDFGRFQATEGLFNPDAWGLDHPGLHKLVHKAIQECSMDIRKEMSRSIFLAGGVSQLPGLADRLASELDKLTPPSIKPKVHSSPYRYHAAYIGACVLAQSNTFSQSRITKQEWHKQGNSVLRKWAL